MMRPNSATWCVSILLSVAMACCAAWATPFRDMVEADWLLQEQVRTVHTREVTTQSDAAGACDGVKDGKWGFHTNAEESPWWQVDLGEPLPVGCVVVWNRCEGVAARANHLSLLLSDDGEEWRTAYTHDGTVFHGHADKKPLRVGLQNQSARFVRVKLPGKTCLHLDEVEVFAPNDRKVNLALHRPADQSSVSQWSASHLPPSPVDWAKRVEGAIANCRRLVEERQGEGIDSSGHASQLAAVEKKLGGASNVDKLQALYLKARWIQRALTMSDPLLDFETILFAKRVPGSFNHMSDQYIGWWSRPGGGIHLLTDYTTGNPRVTCVTNAFTEPGSFLRPMLSYDCTRVLFAWCRHYPDLAAEKNKLDKNNVPEDAFYSIFEMNVDGTGLRQLTHGKYDDFDARYLPDRRIVFLSTRRGQFVQAGPGSARRTMETKDLPDVYVRCGGGPHRPCVVYTLHTMDRDGGNLLAISPFEMFEWTPSVAHDGRILYSRWDYIDRDNMPYMSLWSTNPDGTSARVVFANHTKAPHCTFEPRSIPGSNKIIFTASGHHAQTMGSLVLLDTTVDTEGTAPMTRLTPEVPFPEIEAWPESFFANPWPLSERLYLVAWGCEQRARQGQSRSANAMGLYLFDARSGSLELLHRDAEISCAWPVPLKPRKRPPVIASPVAWDGPKEGRFLLTDVYRGLKRVKRGDVKALRIVAVPAKTHPTMNYPVMGITRDDPGKCVLGTVPVEADGSAYFRVPAGVIVFFQALDAQGKALQTMRTTTHVQPGQTLSCAGCHESRHQAPNLTRVHAAMREPSRITVGPEGSWPLRFDRLIQPVLDANCVRCHSPGSGKKDAAKFNLTAEKSYESLTNHGKPSLREHVLTRYRQGHSTEGGCTAAMSPLLAKLSDPEGHHGVKLDAKSRERFIVWMDTYAQRLGSFCEAQEQQLAELRRQSRDMLTERGQDAEESEALAMRTTR